MQLAASTLESMQLRDSLRGDLKSPSSSHRVRHRGGLLSQQLEPWGGDTADDRVVLSSQDVEQLKRQVLRLTQVRSDRDAYIQELLAEADAVQRRHESELARRSSWSQREVAERLAAQQHEHDLFTEERSRAHAAALAQQAFNHEREIEELRRALRADGERRLADRLKERAVLHRDVVMRLQSGIEELRQRLQTLTNNLSEVAVDQERELLLAQDEKEIGTTPAMLGATEESGRRSQASVDAPLEGRCTPTSTTQVPPNAVEGIDSAGEAAALHGALEAVALAERAAADAATDAERVLRGARKDADRAAHVGQQLAEACAHVRCSAASAREARVQEEVHAEVRQAELGQRLKEQRRALCCRSREWALAAAAGWGQALLLRVVLVWGAEVRRLRGLAAETQQVYQKRRQRRPLVLARIAADMDNWLHIVFASWLVAAANSRREAATTQQLAEAATEAEAQLQVVRVEADRLRRELSSQLRAQSLQKSSANTSGQLRSILVHWVIATREAKLQAAHRHQSITAAASSSSEIYKLRIEAKKATLELRKQRRAHGVSAIHANLDRRTQSALLAWAAAVREGQREANFQRQMEVSTAESAANCAVLRMEGRRCVMELREQRRRQARRATEADLLHFQQLALRAWASVVGATRLASRVARAAAGEAEQSALRLAETRATEALREAHAQHRVKMEKELGELRVHTEEAVAAEARHGASRIAEALAEVRAEHRAEVERLETQLARLRSELEGPSAPHAADRAGTNFNSSPRQHRGAAVPIDRPRGAR